MPNETPPRRETDWRAIGAIAQVATLISVVAGGVWVVAIASAKVDALQNSLTLFEGQIIQQVSQLRTDLASSTNRLDERVDRLQGHEEHR